MADIQNLIKKQSLEIENLLENVNSELVNIEGECLQTCKSNLAAENLKLKEEINSLKKVLAHCENEHSTVSQSGVQSGRVEKNLGETCKSTAKSEKAAKPSKPANTNLEELLPVDIGRLDFRIGKIVAVEKHPDADSLYVEKVDLNEAQPRTVVSGLVKHMPPEDLQDRMVVLLCNLKPAKMRGITSEAMVMCASTPEKVEVLIPPEGSFPGDLVEFEGFPRKPDKILNPKKKIFETCAPDLKTDANRIATYKGVAFCVPDKGKVVSRTMADVQIK